MKLRCPICRHPIDWQTLACSERHQFHYQGGVLVLLDEPMRRRLEELEAVLSASEMKQERPPPRDAASFPQLPFGPATDGDPEWLLRRHDWEIVSALLQDRGPANLLEIGAWNGWLSHRLAAMGHRLTAIDYFNDRYDGLQAKQFYPGDWLAIQMDISDLWLIDDPFDIIIVNRCLQFAEDPGRYLQFLRTRLTPGGVLILLGLQIFGIPQRKRTAVERARRVFRQRFGVDLFIKDTRGYLDAGDRRMLRRNGVQLVRYPQLRRANWKATLLPLLPVNYYGVYPSLERPGGSRGTPASLPA